MTSQDYVIKAVEFSHSYTNKMGKETNIYNLTLQDTEGVEIKAQRNQLPSTPEPTVGVTIHGTIKQQGNFLKFEPQKQQFGNSELPPIQSNGVDLTQVKAAPVVLPDDTTIPRGGPQKSSNTQKAIQRQHSQDMAIEFLKLQTSLGVFEHGKPVTFEQLLTLADRFDADVDKVAGK